MLCSFQYESLFAFQVIFIPKYFILFELFSEFPFLIVHCWCIEMQQWILYIGFFIL